MRATFVTIGPRGEILHEGALAAGIATATGRQLPVLNDASRGAGELEQNPAPSKSAVGALRAAGLRPIGEAEVRAMSLKEAYDRISPLFLKMRWTQKALKEKKPREHVGTESKLYRTPNELAKSWLGGNYKLDKRPDNGVKAKIIVQGVSLLPHGLLVDAFRSIDAGGQKVDFSEYKNDVEKLKLSSLHYPREAGKTPFSLCVGSSQGCRDACLVFAGHNWMTQKNAKVKMAKTIALLKEPVAFLRFLLHALEAFARKKADYRFVRLNVLQDIPWEAFAPWIFDLDLNKTYFYDYSKVANRVVPEKNYDLTFSFSGENEKLSKAALASGRRVAVVFLGMRYAGEDKDRDRPMPWEPFKTTEEEAEELSIGEKLDQNPKKRKFRSQAGKKDKKPCPAERCVLGLGHPNVVKKLVKAGKPVPAPGEKDNEHVRKSPLPATFWGYPVVDGDLSDLRPLDEPKVCIVALRFKTPFGQEINAWESSFAFATKAYVIDDVVRGLSRNPADVRRVEYLIAGTSERATGFRYDQEVGPDAAGVKEIVAEVRRTGVAMVDRAGQLGG